MHQLSIKEAKDRLRIPELWQLLGLPDKAGKSCRCPWREDHNPSFSVSDGGMLWHDFSTGEGGDAVDFVRLATGLSASEAVRRFIELAGGTPGQPLRCGPALPTKPKHEVRPLPTLPAMRRGKPEEMATLAALRGITVEAVEVSDGAGLLRFGQFMDLSSWFIVDPSGHLAQVRRLDGLPWLSGAKAHTCAGGWASWPVGAGLGDYPKVLLCEGGPDLLAAVHFIAAADMAAQVAPVAMLGAGQKIHSDALPLLTGKRIRICPHADNAGRAAAVRWKEQLESVDCVVDAVDLAGLRKRDGSPVNDLNDCTQIHPEDAGELEGLLNL